MNMMLGMGNCWNFSFEWALRSYPECSRGLFTVTPLQLHGGSGGLRGGRLGRGIGRGVAPKVRILCGYKYYVFSDLMFLWHFTFFCRRRTYARPRIKSQRPKTTILITVRGIIHLERLDSLASCILPQKSFSKCVRCVERHGSSRPLLSIKVGDYKDPMPDTQAAG